MDKEERTVDADPYSRSAELTYRKQQLHTLQAAAQMGQAR